VYNLVSLVHHVIRWLVSAVLSALVLQMKRMCMMTIFRLGPRPIGFPHLLLILIIKPPSNTLKSQCRTKCERWGSDRTTQSCSLIGRLFLRVPCRMASSSEPTPEPRREWSWPTRTAPRSTTSPPTSSEWRRVTGPDPSWAGRLWAAGRHNKKTKLILDI